MHAGGGAALGPPATGKVGDTPDLDARWLAEHALDVGAAYLLAHADTPLPATASARYESLVERRAAGEPLAYIIGRAGFWSLDLRVTPDVLIPRPDTEALVEAASRVSPDAPLAVADLGTGSGRSPWPWPGSARPGTWWPPKPARPRWPWPATTPGPSI